MFLFSLFLFLLLLLFICGHLLLLLFDGIELFCWMLLSAFISLFLFLWSDCLFSYSFFIWEQFGFNMWLNINILHFYIFIYQYIYTRFSSFFILNYAPFYRFFNIICTALATRLLRSATWKRFSYISLGRQLRFSQAFFALNWALVAVLFVFG